MMNKNQQPKLFIEQIDGTTPFKKYCPMDDIEILTSGEFKRYYFHHLLKAAEESIDYGCPIENSYSYININKYKIRNYAEKNKLPAPAKTLLATHLDQQSSHNIALGSIAYQAYKKYENVKNYVMSKELTKMMGEIKVDIPYAALPKNTCMYIQPKDLTDDYIEYGPFDVLGAIYFNGELNGHKYFICAAVEYIHFLNTPKRHIPANFGYYSFKSYGGNRNQITDKDDSLSIIVQRDSATQKAVPIDGAIRTILNTVLYIKQHTKDYKEEFNELSKKIKKREKQKKIYSQKKFIKIGFDNIEKLRLQIELMVKVKRYARRQRYGKGRTKVKTITIEPFSYKRKSYLDKKEEKREKSSEQIR